MKYEAKGEYKKNGRIEEFTTHFEAANEKMAQEKFYALVGGKNNVRKADIKLTELKQTK